MAGQSNPVGTNNNQIDWVNVLEQCTEAELIQDPTLKHEIEMLLYTAFGTSGSVASVNRKGNNDQARAAVQDITYLYCPRCSFKCRSPLMMFNHAKSRHPKPKDLAKQEKALAQEAEKQANQGKEEKMEVVESEPDIIDLS